MPGNGLVQGYIGKNVAVTDSCGSSCWNAIQRVSVNLELFASQGRCTFNGHSQPQVTSNQGSGSGSGRGSNPGYGANCPGGYRRVPVDGGGGYYIECAK